MFGSPVFSPRLSKANARTGISLSTRRRSSAAFLGTEVTVLRSTLSRYKLPTLSLAGRWKSVAYKAYLQMTRGNSVTVKGRYYERRCASDSGKPPRYEHFPEPVAEKDEVTVHVHAASLKPVDKQLADGSHYAGFRELPVVCGIDGVGSLDNGKRVFFGGPRQPYGSMAERTVVSPSRCFPLPDNIDDDVAAAMCNPGLSAWGSLVWRAQLQPGETVLILGQPASPANGNPDRQTPRCSGGSSPQDEMKMCCVLFLTSALTRRFVSTNLGRTWQRLSLMRLGTRFRCDHRLSMGATHRGTPFSCYNATEPDIGDVRMRLVEVGETAGLPFRCRPCTDAVRDWRSSELVRAALRPRLRCGQKQSSN